MVPLAYPVPLVPFEPPLDPALSIAPRRPGNMCVYATEIIADKKKYPYLLSNGNEVPPNPSPSPQAGRARAISSPPCKESSEFSRCSRMLSPLGRESRGGCGLKPGVLLLWFTGQTAATPVWLLAWEGWGGGIRNPRGHGPRWAPCLVGGHIPHMPFLVHCKTVSSGAAGEGTELSAVAGGIWHGPETVTIIKQLSPFWNSFQFHSLPS